MAALPPYRLATLMTIRERKKEEAEHRLAETLAALRKEEAHLKALDDELEQMERKREQLRRDYMDKAMRGQTGAGEAVRHNGYIEHLKDLEKRQKEAIAEQRDVVREHEGIVQQARDALVVATQSLKALEKHREKWLEEVKKEIAAKEEMVMDDIAQTIFLRNRDGGS
jgi:flagellar export protein FliJ